MRDHTFNITSVGTARGTAFIVTLTISALLHVPAASQAGAQTINCTGSFGNAVRSVAGYIYFQANPPIKRTRLGAFSAGQPGSGAARPSSKPTCTVRPTAPPHSERGVGDVLITIARPGAGGVSSAVVLDPRRTGQATLMGGVLDNRSRILKCDFGPLYALSQQIPTQCRFTGDYRSAASQSFNRPGPSGTSATTVPANRRSPSLQRTHFITVVTRDELNVTRRLKASLRFQEDGTIAFHRGNVATYSSDAQCNRVSKKDHSGQFSCDSKPPQVIIPSVPTHVRLDEGFKITFQFTEPVKDFTIEDVRAGVKNAAVLGLAGPTPKDGGVAYEATLRPLLSAEQRQYFENAPAVNGAPPSVGLGDLIELKLQKGAAQDLYGNDSPATEPVLIRIEETERLRIPRVTSVVSEPTEVWPGGTFDVTVTFSETVEGFDPTDPNDLNVIFTSDNGDITSLLTIEPKGSPTVSPLNRYRSSYVFSVTVPSRRSDTEPWGDGVLRFIVNRGAATNEFGTPTVEGFGPVRLRGPNSKARPQADIILDLPNPRAPVRGSFPIIVRFTDDVTDFNEHDIEVTNGSLEGPLQPIKGTAAKSDSPVGTGRIGKPIIDARPI